MIVKDREEYFEWRWGPQTPLAEGRVQVELLREGRPPFKRADGVTPGFRIVPRYEITYWAGVKQWRFLDYGRLFPTHSDVWTRRPRTEPIPFCWEEAC